MGGGIVINIPFTSSVGPSNESARAAYSSAVIREAAVDMHAPLDGKDRLRAHCIRAGAPAAIALRFCYAPEKSTDLPKNLQACQSGPGSPAAIRPRAPHRRTAGQ